MVMRSYGRGSRSRIVAQHRDEPAAIFLHEDGGIGRGSGFLRELRGSGLWLNCSARLRGSIGWRKSASLGSATWRSSKGGFFGVDEDGLAFFDCDVRRKESELASPEFQSCARVVLESVGVAVGDCFAAFD